MGRGSEFTNRAPTGAIAAAVIAVAAAAAWIFSIPRMSGMDMGPGTDLGPFPFFIATWALMMTAMMLPSALASIVPFGRAVSRPLVAFGVVSPLLFAASYIAFWIAVGVAVFIAYNAVRSADLGFLAWNRSGAVAAGAAIIAAGVYEQTKIKRACLGCCRSAADRPVGGSVRAALRYSVSCIGSSAGLMLVLLILGAMSVRWMLVIAALIFLQKVLPFGPRLVTPIALLLIGLGVLVALDPQAVRLLAQD